MISRARSNGKICQRKSIATSPAQCENVYFQHTICVRTYSEDIWHSTYTSINKAIKAEHMQFAG